VGDATYRVQILSTVIMMKLIVLKKLTNLVCRLHVKRCKIVNIEVMLMMPKLMIVYTEIQNNN